MKHPLIALICVVAVLFYSSFTYLYISDFTTDIKEELFELNYENLSYKDVEDIKEIYNNKKIVLYYILNKEHLETIENNIIQLDLSVKYNDMQNAEIYENLLNSAIEDVIHQNKCII